MLYEASTILGQLYIPAITTAKPHWYGAYDAITLRAVIPWEAPR
jgi:hypothetical protein